MADYLERSKTFKGRSLVEINAQVLKDPEWNRIQNEAKSIMDQFQEGSKYSS